MSPQLTGLVFLPFAVASVVASTTVSNTALPRFGAKIVVPEGMFLGAAGAARLTRINPDTNYWSGVAPALLLLGLAAGAVVVVSLDLGVAGTDAARPVPPPDWSTAACK